MVFLPKLHFQEIGGCRKPDISEGQRGRMRNMEQLTVKSRKIFTSYSQLCGDGSAGHGSAESHIIIGVDKASTGMSAD